MPFVINGEEAVINSAPGDQEDSDYPLILIILKAKVILLGRLWLK
jgi:hypothetical protein